MSPRFCFDPPRELFADILPNRALAQWASLWVLPEKVRLSGNELRIISDAFVGKRMAVWKSVAYSKSAMDHLQQKPEVLDRLEKYGVFDPNQQMIGGIISRCAVLTGEGALEIDNFHRKSIYSNVAWVVASVLAELDTIPRMAARKPFGVGVSQGRRKFATFMGEACPVSRLLESRRWSSQESASTFRSRLNYWDGKQKLRISNIYSFHLCCIRDYRHYAM